MHADEMLQRLGGVASRAQLRTAVSRRAIDRALASGEIVRYARNRYALPSVDQAIVSAHAVGGVLCLSSAALHHGWAVPKPPKLPHVSVPKGRKLTPTQKSMIIPHRFALGPGDVVDGVTSKEVTLTHCLRCLPADEALAVADSAARDGEYVMLRRVAMTARGRGAARVREFANAARPEAANAFESALRSIAREVAGLNVEPQLLLETRDGFVRPDLIDRGLRIVLEADSFEWHGGRSALRRDARRYNLLVIEGWLVLRFAWEDVMFDQDYVRDVLQAAVELCGRTGTGTPDVPKRPRSRQSRAAPPQIQGFGASGVPAGQGP